MKKLKELPIWNRKFFGKPVHVAVSIVGVALAIYSTYWVGRSDEINEILNILQEHDGDITFNFWNNKAGKKIAIHMITD